MNIAKIALISIAAFGVSISAGAQTAGQTSTGAMGGGMSTQGNQSMSDGSSGSTGSMTNSSTSRTTRPGSATPHARTAAKHRAMHRTVRNRARPSHIKSTMHETYTRSMSTSTGNMNNRGTTPATNGTSQ